FLPGTAHGVFGSVAGVTGAWSDTVSKLTFDDEYRTKRDMDKNKARSRQGGIKQGLKQGGKHIVGGFASGVGGIVTAPVEGGKTSGVGGFVLGMGRGLVGAVVKPVVGVSDAAVSVAQVCAWRASTLDFDFRTSCNWTLPRYVSFPYFL
ncbi:unnamed protein product, partial [Sphacelaria rigidula]